MEVRIADPDGEMIYNLIWQVIMQMQFTFNKTSSWPLKDLYTLLYKNITFQQKKSLKILSRYFSFH